MEGIKELKEAILGLEELIITGKKAAKVGFKIEALQVLMEADLAKITEGYKGIDKVPAEVKDLDLMEAKEVIELIIQVLNKVKEA